MQLFLIMVIYLFMCSIKVIFKIIKQLDLKNMMLNKRIIEMLLNIYLIDLNYHI